MELRKTLLGRFGAFEPPTMESLLCSVSIVGIPLFIALSTIESRLVRQVIYVSFCVLFAVCCVLFTNLHPIF